MSLKMNFICLVVMFFVRVRGICKTDLTAAEQAFVDMHNELRRLHEVRKCDSTNVQHVY